MTDSKRRRLERIAFTVIENGIRVVLEEDDGAAVGGVVDFSCAGENDVKIRWDDGLVTSVDYRTARELAEAAAVYE
jgi:hypothetical protein